MNNFQKYTDIAFALFNPNREVRNYHVSFLVYKNRLICIAENSHKTTPINLLNPKFNRDGENISGSKGRCSELSVFLKFKNLTNISIKKCVLINVRINRNKQLANSCPCTSCKNLIKYLKLKKVYFSDNEGNFVEYFS